MPLTRAFKDTIRERIARDPHLGRELLREAIECLLSDDLETGKAVLRNYINATMGFETLGHITKKSPKSLMRMFSSTGNPQARNLVDVIGHLRRAEHLRFEVVLKSAPGQPRG